MGEITKEEAVALSAVIYFPDMEEVIGKDKENMTMGSYLEKLRDRIEDNEEGKYPTEETMNTWDEEYLKNHNNPYGGMMSQKEFLEVVEVLENSETLKDMKLKNFKDVGDTGFRAVTLIDPEEETNPIMVFRGTAADGQWDDNLAMFISSQTPTQREAIKYVAGSGLEHIIPIGHSKAGNLAAALAYLFPAGIIERAYSIDGPGFSIPFADKLAEEQLKIGRSLTIGINDARDIVNALLGRPAGYSEYFYPEGKDFEDLPEYQKSLIMNFFGAHKPNYYLANQKELKKAPDALPVGINLLTNADFLYELPPAAKVAAAKFLAGCLYSKAEGEGVKNTKNTRWSMSDWLSVLAAEETYRQVLNKRENTLMKRLSKLYGINFSSNALRQPPNSEVVDGAILECWYCSGSGTLKVPESHGKITKGKAVAIKQDTKKGENICMDEGAECTAELVQVPSRIVGKGDMTLCEPEFLLDWLLTDENKTINGKEIVLKKSVLGCLKGGVVTVFHNGQINRAADLKSMQIRRKNSAQKSLDATKEYGKKQADVLKEYGDDLLKSLNDQAGDLWDYGKNQGNLTSAYLKESKNNLDRLWKEQYAQTEQLLGSPYTLSGGISPLDYTKESLENVYEHAKEQSKSAKNYAMDSVKNTGKLIQESFSTALAGTKDAAKAIQETAMNTWDYLGDMKEIKIENKLSRQERDSSFIIRTAEGILGTSK
ncbi:PAAR-like protein [Clostridium sp. Marseille-P2415]|uniref:PAAR-like protein n=1 Tax=Clostridium sp. Marseille-P2415 TaxID=1805471 RepID=UPI0009883408|nr:PAAR-like protein [Clostridium sp. Marseille-P2415]